MQKGVVITVMWAIKPECSGAFMEGLSNMFPSAKLHPGFRNVRLLKGDVAACEFLLMEEWDTAQHYRNYLQYRAEAGDLETLTAMAIKAPRIDYWELDVLVEA